MLHYVTLLCIADGALIAEQLRDEGYSVQEAGHGEEAWLKLTVETGISIIVSDVMMPVMDGFELCRRVKSNEQTSHLPVILLTAKSSDEAHPPQARGQPAAHQHAEHLADCRADRLLLAKLFY